MQPSTFIQRPGFELSLVHGHDKLVRHASPVSGAVLRVCLLWRVSMMLPCMFCRANNKRARCNSRIVAFRCTLFTYALLSSLPLCTRVFATHNNRVWPGLTLREGAPCREDRRGAEAWSNKNASGPRNVFLVFFVCCCFAVPICCFRCCCCCHVLLAVRFIRVFSSS